MLCSECNSPVKARGLCIKHYRRWQRHRDVNGGTYAHHGDHQAFIEKALSHTSEECLLWPYGSNGGGYGMTTVEDKLVSVHRYICTEKHGKPPSDLHEAAHSCGNGNKGCCTQNHLRWATHLENMQDRVSLGSTQ